MKLTRISVRHGQVEGRLAEAVAWWRADGPGYDDALADRPFKSRRDSSDTDWIGGSTQEMLAACAGQIDMGPYQRALKKLAPLIQRFEAKASGFQSKRKREFSEHDGEWNYDRRFEIAPFQASRRKLIPQKIIKIDVNMCVSGGVSAGDLDAYGAQVWATCMLLERMGRQTEIAWIARNGDDATATTQRRRRNGDETIRNRYTVRLLLKKPGEYLAPSLLAATLTTNFYRRMGFNLCAFATSGNGIKTPFGLGPTYYTAPAHYADGVLTFCPAHAYTDGSETLQKELLKTLSG